MMKQVLLLLMVFCAVNTNAQTISLFAGGGTLLGDGGPATAAHINNSVKGLFDKYGNYYVASLASGNRIRKVDTNGIITTFAGTGVLGYNGDGILATTAQLNLPSSIAFDSLENLYITEIGRNCVRKVDKTTGLISTIVGNGTASSTGDGLPATAATLNDPQDLCFDKFGNLYIAEYAARVRRINPSGLITTFAGNGIPGYSGDGSRADTAKIGGIEGLCTDTAGNIYLADNSNSRIFKISTSGIITTIAGTSTGYLFNGDDIPATIANIDPYKITVDDSGNLFIAEYHNYRVRMVDRMGIIHTVAGNGIPSSAGDGGPATNASMLYPNGVALDACGNLYIPEANNGHVRKVTYNSSCNPHGFLEPLDVKSQNLELTISPNPVSTTLSVSYPNQFYEVTIYNLINQTLFTQTYNTTKAEIDMSGYPAGVYIVRVRDKDGGQIVRKVVKE